MASPKRSDWPACYCGHSAEEHGRDPDHPGSSACRECECIAYEADEHDELDGMP